MTVIVKLEHMRELGYCSRGARYFFQLHNLDWSKFIKEGLPAEDIEATGDVLALKVVEVARGSWRRR